ncbi:hypothetical protein [Dictyobacter aurantiacus]|nr:hypothetical protein [Dictyobacter aurantiacus]
MIPPRPIWMRCLGLLVAFAVILHDIGDGLNTMTLLLLNKLT